MSDTRCATANCIFSGSARGAAALHRCFEFILPPPPPVPPPLPFSLDGFPCTSCLGIVSCALPPDLFHHLAPLQMHLPTADYTTTIDMCVCVCALAAGQMCQDIAEGSGEGAGEGGVRACASCCPFLITFTILYALYVLQAARCQRLLRCISARRGQVVAGLIISKWNVPGAATCVCRACALLKSSMVFPPTPFLITLSN